MSSRCIALMHGYVAMVDQCDYESLSKHHWRVEFRGPRQYARRFVSVENGKQVHAYMHVEILGRHDGMQIDHIDGNGLNNQRSNLRLCTRSQNQMNRRNRVGGERKYKGVGFHRQTGKWRAFIARNGKTNHLGLFDTPERAALAYNDAARKSFGEYAHLNNIEVGGDHA